MRGVEISPTGTRRSAQGRNVVSTAGAPARTKDGVTVAKEIELEDKFEHRRR